MGQVGLSTPVFAEDEHDEADNLSVEAVEQHE
jgi:hypothetical protein